MVTTIPLLALMAVLYEVNAVACVGQSCYVAALSGSTEEPFAIKNGKKPAGGNASGDACIKNWYKKLGMPTPAGLKRYQEMTQLEAYTMLMTDPAVPRRVARGTAGTTVSSVESAEVSTYEFGTETDEAEQESDATLEKRQGACPSHEVLYARGTMETGALGLTVGPNLQTSLSGSKWKMRGITSSDGYDASLAGIFCIGMTGGMACKDLLAKRVAACPNTKFVAAGYSQGAMVARICVAYSTPEVKAKVVGILTYGDPFNGATVKGYPTDKIKIFCNASDGVCKGDFNIGSGHLSYSTGDGAKWLKTLSD